MKWNIKNTIFKKTKNYVELSTLTGEIILRLDDKNMMLQYKSNVFPNGNNWRRAVTIDANKRKLRGIK